MSAEDVLDQVCETCREQVTALFSADPRPPPVIIAGERSHAECCFVADEVRFLDGGRLVFEPSGRENNRYCETYFLVCRKLIVVEGGEPLPFDVCGTENPEDAYHRKNLITWRGRLTTATPGGPPSPDQAARGDPDWDRNTWQDVGQGNSGADGAAGSNGDPGAAGASAMDAPSFALVCLEVEFVGLNAHLTIDFDGQVGGEGGRGQHGGPGGDGMGGRNSKSDNTWPGKGCDREAGHGGDGGNHGDGGAGGRGGDGGDAGAIYIVSTKEHVAGSGFVSGKVGYVNDGGNEGAGGLGGFGEPAVPTGYARGGRGGLGGTQCDGAVDGDPGGPGWPPREPLSQGSSLIEGAEGAPGAAQAIELYEIIPHPCSDPIPLDARIDDVQPATLCRGFSSASSNNPVTVSGQHLAQVSGVECSLAGVTATILPTSDDVQLNLLVDIGSGSDIGSGDLILHRVFGPPQTITGALAVHRFEVLSVTPNEGERGEVVAVTINGTCFDPTAVVQNVVVSGALVSTDNVAVLDQTTLTCDIDVGTTAMAGQRDVTVQLGASSHTLVNGFRVTVR